MAAQKGRNLLIKIGDGNSPQTYTTFGGLLTKNFSIAGEAVDVTTSDDAPNDTSAVARKLLANAGVVTVTVSGTGIFQDDAPLQLVRELAFNNGQEEFQIVFDNDDIAEGLFTVTSFEYSGEHNNGQQYSLTLESAGPITYQQN